MGRWTPRQTKRTLTKLRKQNGHDPSNYLSGNVAETPSFTPCETGKMLSFGVGVKNGFGLDADVAPRARWPIPLTVVRYRNMHPLARHNRIRLPSHQRFGIAKTYVADWCRISWKKNAIKNVMGHIHFGAQM
jgi:hypothetical protein